MKQMLNCNIKQERQLRIKVSRLLSGVIFGSKPTFQDYRFPFFRVNSRLVIIHPEEGTTVVLKRRFTTKNDVE
jgi:hypothetical protein